jgi:hypothetical protein
MTSRSKHPAVLVDWIDSTSFSQQRWRPLEESQELTPSTIRSAGFLVNQTKKFITLTGSLCEEGNASGCLTIPRGCIQRMRRLK